MSAERIYPPFLFYLVVFPMASLFLAILSGKEYIPVLVSFGLLYFLLTFSLYVLTFSNNSAIVFAKDAEKVLGNVKCWKVLRPMLSYVAATFVMYAGQTVLAISARSYKDCVSCPPMQIQCRPLCLRDDDVPRWLLPSIVVSAVITFVGALATTVLPFYMRKISLSEIGWMWNRAELRNKVKQPRVYWLSLLVRSVVLNVCNASRKPCERIFSQRRARIDRCRTSSRSCSQCAFVLRGNQCIDPLRRPQSHPSG